MDKSLPFEKVTAFVPFYSESVGFHNDSIEEPFGFPKETFVNRS